MTAQLSKSLYGICTWQRRAARRHGIAEPLVGAISFAQRFASNLSLHPHLHLVVPDGVFFEADGRVLFRALPKPTVEDLERVAARIARQVRRWIEQHELLDEPRDGLALTYPSAAQVGQRAGFDSPPLRLQRLAALVEGFSLEAGRHVHQHDRAGLERLCRYGCRPPLAVQRLSRGSDDQLVLRFKRPLADGSTEVRLSPMELMRRLATIVPPPGFHLVCYHGLFASRSKLRSKVVPGAPKVQEASATIPAEPPAWAFPPSAEDQALSLPFPAPSPRERYLCWAELLKRTRLVDVLRCEKCDRRMELVAFVTDPNLAAGVLQQLGMSIPARAPPS